MANYPLPPWIPGPPDVAGQFMGGLRAGAAIQEEQQRLAQEANLTQMRLMLQQQESERQNQLERERLAQTRAYQQQEISLRQQELAQQKAVNDIKIQESARLFQAQQQFQQWMAANPDKDPAEGILKFFPGTDAGTMAGYGTIANALTREKQVPGPATVEEYEGEKFLRIPEKGGNYRMQQIRTGAQDPLERQAIMDELRNLEKDRRDLKDELAADPARFEAARIDALPADKRAAAIAKLDESTKSFYDAYEAKKASLAQLEEDIATFRSQRSTGARAPRETAPPGAGGTGGFRIKSVDGKPWTGTAAPAAPPDWTGGAAVMPRPANIPTPPGFGAGLSQPPLPPPAPQPTPTLPGAPFLAPQLRPLGPPMPQSAIPGGTPGSLFDTGLTPNTARYGESVRAAQKRLTEAMGQLNPNDLVAGAKRLGVDASYDPDSQMYYGISGGQSRDDFESELSRLASDKNLNPFQ